MLDVALTAEVMLRERLPEVLMRRLAEPLGGARAVDALCFLVALHDMGKISPAFQKKADGARAWLEGAGFDFPLLAEMPHGEISVWSASAALRHLECCPDAAWRVARAVGAHHGTFPRDEVLDADELPEAEGGYKPMWAEARRSVAAALARVFGIEGSFQVPRGAARDHSWVVLLAGLTSVADWIGSMAEVFVYERPPADLDAYVARARSRARQALDAVGFDRPRAAPDASFRALFPGFTPWPLHVAVESLRERFAAPGLVIIEAPMGEGKTEAALMLAEAATAGGAGGLYVGLPTQATANQLFGRVVEFLERTREGDHGIQLAHGEKAANDAFGRLLSGVYDDDPGGERKGRVRAERWFVSAKRALLAPFGVGTVDQALLSVMRTKHAFVRLFALAGKTVVLDEVHAYDAYTSTLIDSLVQWLARAGAHVVILSATLPRERRLALVRAYAGREAGCDADVSYPRITWAGHMPAGCRTEVLPLTPRSAPRRLDVARANHAPADVGSRLAELVHDGGCVAAIANTVRRAQEIMRAVLAARAAGTLAADTELLLLHARFPTEERLAREDRLKARLGRQGSRPDRCIVVGTQVLEQSLDVDFDALITDVAPIDLVLQRAGRLHRHERPSRPKQHGRPALEIVVPAGSWRDANLQELAGVYEPFVVRRSLRLLEERSFVELPTDIEPLVEAVYGSPPSPAEGERVLAEYGKFRLERDDDEKKAATRRMPPPDDRDDIFGSLRMPFDEDDPEIQRDLRAETRLGQRSVTAVCLFEHDGQTFFDPECTEPVNLAVPPARPVLRRLLGRSVRLQNPEVVRHLLDAPVPGGWKDVALLDGRRPLLLGPTPRRIGRSDVSLDPDLGLVIARVVEA